MRQALLTLFCVMGCGGSNNNINAAAPDSATVDNDSSVATDSASGTDTTAPPGSAAMIGPCQIFPADNPWNADVSKLPLHKDNAAILANMATTKSLHADWGTIAENYGMPINVGTGAPPARMTWTETWGRDESDKLPCSDGYQWCYPIPSTCKLEAPGDSHLLYLDTAGAPNNCTLYELWRTEGYASGGWRAANGAIFKLGTNALRPDGWTSGDAAGLPIAPGLVRFDEVKAGAVKHAIRFTMVNTLHAYVHPATHAAGKTSPSTLPPMGLRLRLKASVAIDGYTKEARAILQAMKTYGIILADNGSDWYFSGEMHNGWSDVFDGIATAFGRVHGSDFEVVDTGPTVTTGL